MRYYLILILLILVSCDRLKNKNFCCEYSHVQIIGNLIDSSHLDEGAYAFLFAKLYNYTNDSIMLNLGYGFRPYLKQKADSLGTRPFLMYYGNMLSINKILAYGRYSRANIVAPSKENVKLYLTLYDKALNQSCIPHCKSFFTELINFSDLHLITLNYDTIKCVKNKDFKILWGVPEI